MRLKLLAALAAIGLATQAGTASAGNVDVHIGIGTPGVVYHDDGHVDHYYAPAPVYHVYREARPVVYYDHARRVRHFHYRHDDRHRHHHHSHRHDRHCRHGH